MNEKIVTSQAELDAIPVDYNGRIIISSAPRPRAKVLREVPLEEAGLMGKIIAKRRENG